MYGQGRPLIRAWNLFLTTLGKNLPYIYAQTHTQTHTHTHTYTQKQTRTNVGTHPAVEVSYFNKIFFSATYSFLHREYNVEAWLLKNLEIKRGDPVNKADRPANSRERWAGALMEVRSLFFLIFASCDGRTYLRTYGRTDKPAYRVACSRLKKKKIF